jgi:hypothetical protein
VIDLVDARETARARIACSDGTDRPRAVLKGWGVMTKQLGVGLGIVLAALVAGIGLYFSVGPGHSTAESGGRIYEVHYVWDNGVKSLRIVDAKTGVEDTRPRWRAKVASVAESELPKILQSAGLTRAVERFYVDCWDQEARYLPVQGTPSDPALARGPDVTPLMSAIVGGETPKALALIAAGANVNASDQHGGTALILAAGAGDTGTVQALLAGGAQVNARNRDGETALFSAAFLGRLAVVRELVRHGADVNATSRLGVTPLMEASRNRVVVVKFLLGSGANVNARDVLGGTALMAAAFTGRIDMVRTLIKAGADVNVKDNEGRTALSRAVAGGHGDVARLLKQAGAHD